MSVSSIDWSTERHHATSTQQLYMRHRFLRTVQKFAPWLAIVSIVTMLWGLPFLPVHSAASLFLVQSSAYLIFMFASLGVVYQTWHQKRVICVLILIVAAGFLFQLYLRSSALSFNNGWVTLVAFSSDQQGNMVFDLGMALLVLLAAVLHHRHCNRASQVLLSIAVLMPVTGLLAWAYHIPHAYGQLSLLTTIGGSLCAAALLARQITATPMSYLLLLDDTGKHLRWIVCILITCAIVLGGVGVFFDNDLRLTPIIITAALILIIIVMTLTYYHKGVMHEQVLPPEDLAFASELEAAIAQEAFYLVYQPQLDFQTGKLVGVEALIRWQHPERGVVSPNQFIGVAELTGLIVPMGAWVLKAACAQAASWTTGELSRAKVSVNVSPLQLNTPCFAEYVLLVLQETGLAPERLVIELTESAFIHADCTGNERLQKLKQHGIKLAIDDFGTGYSCLAYLRDIPGDYLKVDRSFVNDIPGKERSEAVISAIVVLGKNLHYQIVAEGVETEDQADYLKALGCDFVQGFLYAKPMTAQALQDWMRNRADLA
ncbi:EAL domain-containing protein [Methylophilus sp. YYY-1]|uniref:EAL domain-containing protein n=1 Tax=Methylophilus sp. YYY-1 TaxID=2682087 RepID=UPI0023B34F65|nr:EAL domain-containing protein [Methylophilus sp. YYY-1]